ncbi:MAG: glycosyltransferase [Nitrospira sp.]|nr:glycosyltransferase [Nitrospira sp.]
MSSRCPLLSIVTPCLNGRRFIEEAIQSVLDQDYPNVEHVVVDGGSTDGTLDLLKKYPHLRVVSEPDQGLYDALNKAVRLSRGEIIGHLNCDDLYEARIFGEVVRKFETSPDIDAVCGGVDVFERTDGGDRRIIAQYMRPQDLELSVNSVTLGPAITNARFFRRRVLEQVGLYNTRFRIAADREFLLRAALAGTRSTALKTIVYHYRAHPQSMTFHHNSPHRLKMLDEFLEIAEAHMRTVDTSARQEPSCRMWHARTAAEATLRALREKKYTLALGYAKRGIGKTPGWPMIFMEVLLRRLATGGSH